MKDVKKGKGQQSKPAKKEGGFKQGGTALSDAQLGKVTGGVKANTEFNPQPEPPGRPPM